MGANPEDRAADASEFVYTQRVLSDKTLRSPNHGEPPPDDSGVESASDGSGERAAPDEHLDELRALRFSTGRLSDSQQRVAEQHLEDCASCRELVERVVQWSESTRDRKAPEWRGTALPPGLLLAERYRIQRFVARGGMGEVYEVEDTAFGESIALKTVASPYTADAEAVAQLKAEVLLARRVSHKNVCRIYDIGRHEPPNGPALVFLTMEYVQGKSLGDELRDNKKLPVDDAREIAVGILSGLQAAHEAGVLHRDLKADNVMLRREANKQPTPVLMDFGLASALNPNSSRVSGDRSLVGSLAYMAPEQVQGQPLRVATDLYAFGVILFEMLTGRLPFIAPTPAMAAIMRLQQAAPRLSAVDPELPASLNDVVARCLERDPRARYRSAKEILAALSDDSSTAARQSAPPPQVETPRLTSSEFSVHATRDVDTTRGGSHVPRRPPWLLVALTSVALLAGAAIWLRPQRATPLQTSASKTEATANSQQIKHPGVATRPSASLESGRTGDEASPVPEPATSAQTAGAPPMQSADKNDNPAEPSAPAPLRRPVADTPHSVRPPDPTQKPPRPRANTASSARPATDIGRPPKKQPTAAQLKSPTGAQGTAPRPASIAEPTPAGKQSPAVTTSGDALGPRRTCGELMCPDERLSTPKPELERGAP